MEGLPGWAISSMPGPPPRQHEHARLYTPITHSLIHSNKVNIKGWLWRPNNIRGPYSPKVSWHFPYRREKKNEKSSPRKLVPAGDQTQARCVTDAHATAYSTVVFRENFREGQKTNRLNLMFWGTEIWNLKLEKGAILLVRVRSAMISTCEKITTEIIRSNMEIKIL